MKDLLKGKKTYIICALTIVWAVVGTLLHQIPADEAINLALAALGGAAMRHGIES